MKSKTKARRKVSTALARLKDSPIAESPGVLGVFERLAKDPRLTVEKLGTLVDLQERIMRRNAQAEFDVAYRVMQPLIPRIARRGAITNKAGEVQSRYSKYEDIREIVDPILQQHGFHVHHATTWPSTGVAEIIGSLTHIGGHTRESRFRSDADASGGKNAIQGLGSAVQYGRRYTLIDLLGIVQEGVDDDGKKAPKAARRPEQRETVPEERAGAKDGHHARSGALINEAQIKRLGVIIHNSGRAPEEVQRYLQTKFKIDRRAQITNDRYDEICRAIEGAGNLT